MKCWKLPFATCDAAIAAVIRGEAPRLYVAAAAAAAAAVAAVAATLVAVMAADEEGASPGVACAAVAGDVSADSAGPGVWPGVADSEGVWPRAAAAAAAESERVWPGVAVAAAETERASPGVVVAIAESEGDWRGAAVLGRSCRITMFFLNDSGGVWETQQKPKIPLCKLNVHLPWCPVKLESPAGPPAHTLNSSIAPKSLWEKVAHQNLVQTSRLWLRSESGRGRSAELPRPKRLEFKQSRGNYSATGH